jgi:ribosome-associated translation inhibitor RaiA
MSEHEDRATVESSLRLGAGFEADERSRIVDTWSSLTRRLASFPEGAVELDLSVKERETPSQRMVLEARIAHEGHFVATSHRPDVLAALNEVRDDLIRQLTDAKNRTEPRNARALRDTIRHHD